MTRRLRLAPAVTALALLVLAGALSACTPGNAAVEHARGQIGTRYTYGGSTPKSGFDCSGLTSWAWGQAGVTIPRTSSGQFDWTDRVSRSQLQPGDLVFYSSSGPGGRVSHVALYAGDGTIIHARNSSMPVREDRLDSYWTSNLVGYGRIPASAMPRSG